MTSDRDDLVLKGAENPRSGTWPATVERTSILGGFLLVALFIAPWGEFPLNDDWNFALATWHFADHGTFRLARFTGMSLLGQVVWGALWTELFGKSHVVLRLSTMVLAAGTLLLVHRWLERAGASRLQRCLGVMALLANPIFVWSSFTYMTQIPFLFVTVLGLYFAWLAIEKGSLWSLGVSSTFVVVSYFVRQTGIASIVPVVIWIMVNRKRIGATWGRWLFVASLPAVVFFHLFFSTNLLDGYPDQIDQHFNIWYEHGYLKGAALLLWQYIAFNFQFGALFFLPLVAVAVARSDWRRRGVRIAGVIVIAAFAVRALQFLVHGEPLPYFANRDLAVPAGQVFTDFGLGPVTLRDVWVLGLSYPYGLPQWLRVLLTVVTLILGGLLLIKLVGTSLDLREADTATGKAVLLATLFCIAGTLVLLASGFYFDRYSLDSLWPLAIALSLMVTSKRRLLTALGGTTLIAAFSILATQEYHRWNAKRWEAFAYLRSQGVAMANLDGGYEINQHLIGGFDGPLGAEIESPTTRHDRYIITVNHVVGYREIKRFPFRSFLGFRRVNVYVLRLIDLRNPPKPIKLPGIRRKQV